MRPATLLGVATGLAAASLAAEAEFEWSAQAAAELRWFASSPLDPDQHGANLSLSLEPELYYDWDDRYQSFTLVPFLRVDQHDGERTHFDLREATWLWVGDDWELRTGIRKLFWGVTETFHLVDVINQTDLVEDIDEEDALGQPMVNLALIRDWGTVDLFLLPYFRERTFPGREGRLRTPIPVDDDRADYESGAEDHRLDTAIRYSHFFGDFDIGLYHFYGTSRDPIFRRIALDGSGRPVLIPRYDVIHQTGLDLQATLGAWLWKLEAIYRDGGGNLLGRGESFGGLVGGFEYTFYGLFDTAMDLGVIGEYLYDSRQERATTIFQDDITGGFRLALNDVAGSALLFTATVDRDTSAQFYNLEASRRLGEQFSISLRGRAFVDIPPDDPASGIRDDDYLELELEYHF